MNAILMSIQPKWASKILSGDKTIEIRKTAPKPPFKVYVYCTKSGKQLNMPVDLQKDLDETGSWDCINSPIGNGKIVAEFVCDKVDYIINHGSSFKIQGQDDGYTNSVADSSCLSFSDLRKYLQDKNGYALHISDLKIYDKPKQLEEFRVRCEYDKNPCKKFFEKCCHKCTYYEHEAYLPPECTVSGLKPVTHAPQNYIYVEEL